MNAWRVLKHNKTNLFDAKREVARTWTLVPGDVPGLQGDGLAVAQELAQELDVPPELYFACNEAGLQWELKWTCKGDGWTWNASKMASRMTLCPRMAMALLQNVCHMCE
jgi:hypothetical protein